MSSRLLVNNSSVFFLYEPIAKEKLMLIYSILLLTRLLQINSYISNENSNVATAVTKFHFQLEIFDESSHTPSQYV